MWQHEHRDRMEGYQKYREATGEDADDIKTSPKLTPFTGDVWEAWKYLSGSRQYTMGGAAGIAISEILAYAVYRGIHDADSRDRLLELITAMDNEYLKLQHPKEGH